MFASDSSRRTFLKRAGVGAAAVGAATALPLAGAGSADAAEPKGPEHAGPFVAWIKDAKSGEISILVGESELITHDRKLARRLAQLAARAQ